MTEKDTQQTYLSIIGHLKHKRLGKALAELQALGQQPMLSTAAIAVEAKSLYDDHQRLLDYFAAGTDDPQRIELQDQIFEKAWQLADRLHNVSEPASVAVSMGDIILRLAELYAAPDSDQLLAAAFEQIADSRRFSHDELQEVHQAITNEGLPEYVRATLLSALMMHLLQWFDAEAVELLYIYTLDDQPVQIQMQAWVALAFILLIHQDRIAHLPRLREQYNMLIEENPKLWQDLQTSIILCHDAKGADKRMQEMASHVDEKDESKMEARIEEFYSFISEGIDLSYEVFSQLMKMPFFSSEHCRHHWFMPFSIDHPVIRAIIDGSPQAEAWVKLLKMSVAQCETDKYGAVISMDQMNHRLMATIGQKLMEKGLIDKHILPLPAHHVLKNYLHDLYRYFSLRHHQAEHSPFAPDLLLTQIPWLSPAWKSDEKLQQISSLLMRQHNWSMAAEVNDLMMQASTNEQTLVNQLYCLKKLADIGQGERQAILAMLMRYHRLYPASKQMMRMLADFYHQDGYYSLEETILTEGLEHYPDETNLLMSLGRCLNAQRRYQDSLSPLFKADMIREGLVQTSRELTRALIGMGDSSRAQTYADRLMARKAPQREDHLLAGILDLAKGNIRQAYTHLTNLGDEAIALLEGETRLILDAGISPETLQLMVEALQTERNI